MQDAIDGKVATTPVTDCTYIIVDKEMGSLLGFLKHVQLF